MEDKFSQPLVVETKTGLSPALAFELFQGEPFSFFLDSAMNACGLGRFSFMGSNPFLVLRSRGQNTEIWEAGGRRQELRDPFEAMAKLLSEYRLETASTPVPFQGGMVGYLAYDLCHSLERLPANARDDLELPEAYIGCYDTILVFDHLTGRSYIVSTGWPEKETSARRERAEKNLTEMERKLAGRLATPLRNSYPAWSGSINANFNHRGYLKAVQRAREYIIAGDIFQVNLSQRFDTILPFPPVELYRRFRQINPAPFAAYLNFDNVSIVSASPERFMRLQGDRVVTRPMKGTRPRGKTPEEDMALASELISSIKDRAENVMIVDLERNDIGRVCRFGSVRVPELFNVEKYPTVFQLTSTVEGRLRGDKGTIDLLRATFPGGSVTGAPKVRAMEIIDKLEPTRRSVYTGAIGYLGFNGDMDWNIAIRTFIVKKDRAYFQAGGGIVFDSDPEGEYQETLHKARALFMALGCNMDELDLE